MIGTLSNNSSESDKKILEDIKSLRLFIGDENVFWPLLLSKISALSKSPLAFYFENENGEWILKQEFYGNETIRKDASLVLASALNILERAHQNGFAHERLDALIPLLNLPCILAVKTESEEDAKKSALALIVEKESSSQFKNAIARTLLVSDIPFHYYIRNRESRAEGGKPVDRLLVSALETVTKVMDKENFFLACMTLVNEIVYRFNCSQVSLGWLKNNYIRAVAISHLEDFKKQSEAVRALEGIFEEAYEQKKMIVYPKTGDDFSIDISHQRYLKKVNLSQVVTLPIFLKSEIVAVLTCELTDSALSVHEIDTLSLIINQVAPWIGVLHRRERWFGARFASMLKSKLGSLLGFEHTLIKAATVLASAILLYSFIGDWDYRVEGTSTLQTDSVHYISAPFDGLIRDVKVHEGDEVKEGNLVLVLDTQELLLREAQESAEIVRYMREAERYRAVEALADMKISQSKVSEARARFEKVRYYVDQANIKAQFSGIVVEGDNQKLIGSPVSKGDILLKIAEIGGMYVKIKISERDIDQIAKGARGELKLLCRPDETIKISVDKMIPMAEVDQREGNVFVLRAGIEDKPMEWWRPGMSGVAKIDAGERKIIWIATHRLIEFIRMYFWW